MMSCASILSATWIPLMTLPSAAYLPFKLGFGPVRMKNMLSAVSGFQPTRYGVAHDAALELALVRLGDANRLVGIPESAAAAAPFPLLREIAREGIARLNQAGRDPMKTLATIKAPLRQGHEMGHGLGRGLREGLNFDDALSRSRG